MGLLTQTSQIDARALINEYDLTNLKAHSAFMQGQESATSELYLQAFELSFRLLSRHDVTTETVRLSVNACLNCFDFCPPPNDNDERHYLALTAHKLDRIVSSHLPRDLRSCALTAYAEIARLCYQLAQKEAAVTSQKVVEQCQDCWQRYCSELIPSH